MNQIPLHPKYKEFLPRWKEWRDACAGKDAIKAGRETYLPRLAEQTDVEYKTYIGLATYYNASGKTLDALSGALFFRPASISLPPDLATLESGRKGITSQIKQAARELVVVGRCGVLAEVDTAGLPRVYLYEAEHILNWCLDEDCNLLWVILVEASSAQKGEFEVEVKPRYRVLQLQEGSYVQRVFEEVEKDGKKQLMERLDLMVIPTDKAGVDLDFIPFVFIDYEGEDGEEGEVGFSPISDLASVNVGHYQLGAELRHLLRLTACPMLVISGLNKKDQPDTLPVGGSTVIYTPADGSATWAEISGAGAGVLREELVRMEDQMSRLGVSALRAGKADAETADSIKLQQKGESSVLSTVADALENGFTRLAQMLGRWYGLDDKAIAAISIGTSKEFFDSSLSIPEAEFLFKLYLHGDIDLSDLLESLQGGGVLTQEVYQRALERVRKATATNAKANPNNGSSNGIGAVLQTTGQPVGA